MSTGHQLPTPASTDSGQEKRHVVRTLIQTSALLLIAAASAFAPLFFKQSGLLVAITGFLGLLLNLVIFVFQQQATFANGTATTIEEDPSQAASKKSNLALEWLRITVVLFATLLMIQLFTHSFQGTVDDLVRHGLMTVTARGYSYLSTVFCGMLALLVWVPASVLAAKGVRLRLGRQPSFVYLASAGVMSAVGMRLYNYGTAFLSNESVARTLGTELNPNSMPGDRALLGFLAVLTLLCIVMFQGGLMWVSALFFRPRKLLVSDSHSEGGGFVF